MMRETQVMLWFYKARDDLIDRGLLGGEHAVSKKGKIAALEQELIPTDQEIRSIIVFAVHQGWVKGKDASAVETLLIAYRDGTLPNEPPQRPTTESN